MSLDDYEKHEKLGEGTYGVVYRATNTTTGEVVALKQMRLDHEEQGISVTALRESVLIRNLHHMNIVTTKDVVSSPDMITLVTEFVEYDVRRYLDSVRSGLTPSLLVSDIKPQNLLINRQGFLKICDFGLARTFGLRSAAYTREVITLWYRPPELLLGATEYDVAVDIWSAGCVIAEMARGSPLFTGDSEIDQVYRIFRVTGTPNEGTWPGLQNLPGSARLPMLEPKSLGSVVGTSNPLLVDLLSQMLQVDPARRISAVRALSHPYFTDLPAALVEACKPEGVALDFPKL